MILRSKRKLSTIGKIGDDVSENVSINTNLMSYLSTGKLTHDLRLKVLKFLVPPGTIMSLSSRYRRPYI